MQQIAVFYGFGPIDTDKLAQAGVSVDDFKALLDVRESGIGPIELFTRHGSYCSRNYLFFGFMLRSSFDKETICTPFDLPDETYAEKARTTALNMTVKLLDLGIVLDSYAQKVGPRVGYTDSFAPVECDVSTCISRYEDKLRKIRNSKRQLENSTNGSLHAT